jgi:hypothetical protein
MYGVTYFTGPGVIALTVMPCTAPNSLFHVQMKLSTADFEAEMLLIRLNLMLRQIQTTIDGFARPTYTGSHR